MIQSFELVPGQQPYAKSRHCQEEANAAKAAGFRISLGRVEEAQGKTRARLEQDERKNRQTPAP